MATPNFPPGQANGYSSMPGRPALDHNRPSPSRAGVAQPWSPAALLDPQRHFASQNRSSTPTHLEQLPPTAALETGKHAFPRSGSKDEHPLVINSKSTNNAPFAPNGLTFQFVGPPTDAWNPPSGVQVVDLDATEEYSDAEKAIGTPSDGVSSMIERNFHIQDRQQVPEPKRRKIEDGLPGDTKRFQSSSEGFLARGVRQEQKQASVQVTQLNEAIAGAFPPLKGPFTVDLTEGGEGGAKGHESYEEVCFGSVMVATVDCHKVPAPKPGSQAMGGPAYWPTVKIVLRRKVNEKAHIIQACDHTRSVFGSLDKNSAECIAPLMDVAKVHLRTEAKIPSRRKNDNEDIGDDISRSYRIELVLYGAASFGRAVGKRLTKYKLKLVKPNHYDAKIRLAIPDQIDPATGNPTAKPEVSSTRGSAASSSSQPIRSTEVVRSEVLSVFDSMANAEDLPEMEPDAKVKTTLLRHQKQALYFMVHREKPLAAHADSKLGTSMWLKKTTPSGRVMYHNVVTGQTDSKAPSETLGGILADMMGLGKTLSILSLVASTGEQAAAWHAQPFKHSTTSEMRRRLGLPTNYFGHPLLMDMTPLKCNARATLLVCPLSTVTNWEQQIKQHLAPDSFKYHIYHGPNRIKDIEKLSDFDLVITTYGSVSSELTARSRGKAGPHPLEEIGWFRVVLDEAHMIRESSTLQFKAICRLQPSRRWAVTGTPVQNRLEDLGSLLCFLRLKPFDDRTQFNEFIVNPFRACDPNILTKLRVLVDTITLRRLKDKIELPKRTDVIVRLQFSDEEATLYNFYSRNAQDRLKVLTHHQERILGGKVYMHILQAILRLRLICAHGRDLLREDDLKLMQGMTRDSAISLDEDDDTPGHFKERLTDGEAYSVFDLLVNTDYDQCTHCKNKLSYTDETSTTDIRSEKQEHVIGYMTPCLHVYCPSCIKHFADPQRKLTYKSDQPGVCPECQASVMFSCVEIRHGRAETEHDTLPHQRGGGGAREAASGNGSAQRLAEYSGPHTKTRALVQELLQNKAHSEACPDEPPYKSVVFSGWTSHLDLIELALDKAGITHCRLDGKMTRLARTQAMDAFRESASIQVMLVSIMAGGLGLNLTAANTVYVMEPQYNPAAEAQAIDRVHRLGQRREVRTVRYIMQDSFEERMLENQNRKIKISNLSMNRNDQHATSSADAARQRLEDLRSLFR
ncbi:hypothetical protein SEPCBS119000_002183 [Sporothrix epigloea]|uniref:Uncharacterized protein n=1 Tax=Sporothrix epigloea TaxID=1892477 RepID=A0ABP0DEY7_9PEZI